MKTCKTSTPKMSATSATKTSTPKTRTGRWMTTLMMATVPLAACSSSDDVNPVPLDTGLVDATTDTTATTDATDATPDTKEAGGGDASDAGADLGTDTAKGDSASDGEGAADAIVDGGTAADCLTTTDLGTYFTLGDASKCVVAQYTVDATFLSSLTWGRHGGPLGFDSSDAAAPKLVRYTVPSGPTGALVAASTAVVTSALPAGFTASPASAFWGGQALDLPFFGWTAISYTTVGGASPGEVLLIGDTSHAIDVRYAVNGFFSETLAGLASSGGRLLYTGLSPITTARTTTNAGGLYAADSCGTAGASPRLLPGGDATCKDSSLIATWEAGSSGPVATDPNDNVFAILSTFGGKQELRGFERSAIARGAAATSGTKIFSTPGYTGELVADGKTVVWQPSDPSTFSALDVQAIDYTVDATGKTVTPSGASRAFLTLKTAGTSVALLRDDRRRIWVGVTNAAAGDAGPTSSTFFVLRTKSP